MKLASTSALGRWDLQFMSPEVLPLPLKIYIYILNNARLLTIGEKRTGGLFIPSFVSSSESPPSWS